MVAVVLVLVLDIAAGEAALTGLFVCCRCSALLSSVGAVVLTGTAASALPVHAKLPPSKELPKIPVLNVAVAVVAGGTASACATEHVLSEV